MPPKTKITSKSRFWIVQMNPYLNLIFPLGVASPSITLAGYKGCRSTTISQNGRITLVTLSGRARHSTLAMGG